MVYGITLWPYKHDRCRTFWTPCRSRYTRNNWKNSQYGVGRSEIVEAIGISYGSVVSILKDHLCMKKLSARWVPRLLTIDHKRNRVTTSIESLALFNHNKDEFLHRFVTVDETTPQHARDQAAVQTVGFAGWIIAEEGQSGFVSLLFSGMHAV